MTCRSGLAGLRSGSTKQLLRRREHKAIQAKKPITFCRARTEILLPRGDGFGGHAMLERRVARDADDAGAVRLRIIMRFDYGKRLYIGERQARCAQIPMQITRQIGMGELRFGPS